MKVDTVSYAPASASPGPGHPAASGAVDFRAMLDKASAAAGPQTPQEELSAWLNKSIGEHIRDAILKELGLTEEDLAAMPPEQRIAMEETITERIKEKMLQERHGAMEAGKAVLAMVAFATDLQKTALDKVGPMDKTGL
jgi:hypothetical protein